MHGYYYGPMMGQNDWGYGLISMGLFVIFMVIVGLVAVRLLRQHNGGMMMHGHTSDPIEIAKTRYAKGEIDKVQFEQLKKDLK